MTTTPPSDPSRWRVLVTGATGRVGFPVAGLSPPATTCSGWRVCRGERDRARLEGAGVVPIVADLAEMDLGQLPGRITHVFHAAARLGREAQEQDWQQVFATNAQASGRLVAACAGAAFVYCSTGSAYAYRGRQPLREEDPPGVHLGPYSLSKIAGEAVVRYAAGHRATPSPSSVSFRRTGQKGARP